jgi:putative ABC transport system substrate-binding protein
MQRRGLIASLALGTLMTPGAGRSQTARKVYRIGIMGLRPTSDLVGPEPRSPSTQAFLDGMRKLGYVYGENFVTEPRGADGRPERFPALAAELVGLQVDVIVASGPALPALKQTTSTIPIVMAAVDDPVSSGFVQSLARPGGNITGLSFGGRDLHAKRLELLKEIVPGVALVAVIWQGSVPGWQAAETAAGARGWKLLSLEVRGPDGIDAAFKAAAEARAGGLLVFASPPLFVHAKQVADLAARYRLPAIYVLRRFVEVGGLMFYGVDDNDIWRHAAAYVDKVLKGASPADLPVEQPTKFSFVINRKAAKALGLAIPQRVLLRADEVIE